MKHVKFKAEGRWADPNPSVPQIEVKAGEIVPVSNELADIVVEAGRAEYVKAPKASNTQEAEDKRGAGDKDAADKGKGKGKGK